MTGSLVAASSVLGVSVYPAPYNSRWITYACFNACSASDPSSSSTAVVSGCSGICP